MRVEIMLYVYLLVCGAMIIFNIITALLFRKSERKTEKVSKNLRYEVVLRLKAADAGFPIHPNWIDFEALLQMGLSSGESVLVALAGNFYNGGFFNEYTPSDIVNYCDAGMTELAAKALWLRKQRINVNTIFD